MKTKGLLLLVMFFLPMAAGADDAVKVGGIWYNLIPKGKVATVARNPYGNYSGKVVIPATFTYNNVDYNVTSIGDEDRKSVV